jgi:putative ABC transport system ATP-binding protein
MDWIEAPATGSTKPFIVKVTEVNHHFGQGDARNQVLFDNSLEIRSGELVVMTGPSGSGKTTLLTLIGALRSVQSGQIEIMGRNLASLPPSELVRVRRRIGFIFQMHNLFESLSALENVKLSLQLGDCPVAERDERCLQALRRIGLAHRSDYKPRALSGGQRQRVAVARALVNKPRLILADEPTAALDKESSLIVAGLLKQLTVEEDCTVLMVTHDTRLIELADRVVNMVDGTIVSNVVLSEAVVVCEFLRGLPLFERLSPLELTNVAAKMKRWSYAPDEIIIREGDAGEEFFLIRDGSADVLRSSGTPPSLVKLASLGPGNCFGEQALIGDEPRNATVMAHDNLQVYTLAKNDFREAMAASPSFREQLNKVFFQRQ